MITYSDYERIKSVEAQAQELGFQLAKSDYRYSSSANFALVPMSDQLPAYSREAEIAAGDLNHIQAFLAGFVRARQYDMLLRLSDDKKRARAEERYCARVAEKKRREEAKQVYQILKTD